MNKVVKKDPPQPVQEPETETVNALPSPEPETETVNALPSPEPEVIATAPLSDPTPEPVAVKKDICKLCKYPPRHDPIGNRICPTAHDRCPNI